MMTEIPLSPSELDLIERLEARTCIIDECWHWNGAKVLDGYGVISFRGEQHRIYRLVFSIYCGESIPNMFVCHTCDNRACWNINHLWQGTPAENTQDMWAKNRQGKFKRGRKIGESWKLTQANVIDIRQQLDMGISNKELAEEYGVSDVMISRIKLRKAWAWL